MNVTVLMYCFTQVTDYVGISMELGCFLAGVVVSSQDVHLAEEMESLVQPVKDFLACLFFGSIGWFPL